MQRLLLKNEYLNIYTKEIYKQIENKLMKRKRMKICAFNAIEKISVEIYVNVLL